MAIRIVLADDHQMLRRGIRRLLEDDPDFQVVGEANSGADAIRLTDSLIPDVVVMDAKMPGQDGASATRAIVSAHSTVKVICLSAHADRHTSGEMLDAGAAGYVLKDSAFNELTEAIRTVVRGKVYLSPTVTEVVLEQYKQARGGPTDGTSAQPITERERQVLRFIADGKSTKEIASAFGLSAKTVETHRRNLMQKLKIESVAELTKYAIRMGISSL